MAKPALNGETLSEFEARRKRVVKRFESMGRGTRMRAALEKGINPAVMYQVTNGRVIDSDMLTRLEEWLEENGTVAA